MQLPNWIPKIRRPFNPAYHSTWEKMSDNDKRWSFLVDTTIVALVAVGLWTASIVVTV